MQARQKQLLAGQNVAISVEDFNHAFQQIEAEARSLGYMLVRRFRKSEICSLPKASM